jgi:hypothetical protein
VLGVFHIEQHTKFVCSFAPLAGSEKERALTVSVLIDTAKSLRENPGFRQGTALAVL